MAEGEKTQDRSAADRQSGRDSEAERLNARLARLTQALDQRQPPSDPAGGGGSPQSFDAANLGFRALAEFVTAVVAAPLIGWQIDVWLGTTPVFLIIFLMLGMVGGLANVYRIAVAPTGRNRGPKP